ncbi:MAG: hypothetical protein JRD89_00365 [Deltaproteobacteria bacterium]|nr:hypothetical protein [Deltaproteobacteria bacterium]
MAIYVVRRRESCGTVKDVGEMFFDFPVFYVDDEVWLTRAANADQAIRQVSKAARIRSEDLTIAVIIGEEVKQDEDSNQPC